MDIGALVALGSNTLVSSMVTDAWEATRHRIARLFSRGDDDSPDAPTERRLETARAQLIAAVPAEQEQVRAELAAQWRVRLTDLVEEYPDAVRELQAIIEEIGIPGQDRGGVTNVIHDGTYHGPVIMGRDITGLSLPSPPSGTG